ncbi:creatininase family protein [Paenibacillus sp. GCM10023252]|uniref:creatininase family protein n=1 Tax=Paenibacillus sp. GCM10023252 TaxID=3252649 RepID=UPI00361F0849
MMNDRYNGKAWDTHFLPRLSRLQVEQLPKENAVVVLPVGATEQHGPALPTYTDTLIGEGFMTETFKHLPVDSNIWLIPALSYGKSTEHMNHPGTITLSAQTLMAVLMDIAQSLARSGFRKLVFWNTHGGNVDLLSMMGREIRIATGLTVLNLNTGGHIPSEGIITAEERRYGIHGGDEEASLVMALRRHWVTDELLPCEFINFPDSPYLGFKTKAFAWVMDDVSVSGIGGDSTLATPEKGEAILARGGKILAEALQQFASFEMRSLIAKREGVVQ